MLVPADRRRPSVVIVVPDTSVGFSDAIGGGLLEEIHHDVRAGSGYCVYADEQRVTRGLPPNPRATILAAILGWRDQTDWLHLHGDLLIVGAEVPTRDIDVPLAILEAAGHAGVLRWRVPVRRAVGDRPVRERGRAATV